MSTLKVNKIRDTAGSADSITLDPNGGAVIAGVTTVSTVKVGSGVTINSDGGVFTTGITTSSSVIVGGGVTISESGIEASGIGITCANINGNQISGRRNKIVNGAVRIAQRGTSHSPGGSSQAYYIDQFEHIATTGASFDATVTQDSSVTMPDGFSKAYKVTPDATNTPTGGGNGMFRMKIEGQNCQDLAYGTSSAKQVTVSFYARSGTQNNGHQYTFQLRHFATDGTQRSINAPFTITYSFQRFIFTFTGDTAVDIIDSNGLGMELDWQLAAGPDDITSQHTSWTTTNLFTCVTGQSNFLDSTSNAFYVTGVQLEVGSQATAFEHLNFGEDLALCQRYFWSDPDDTSFGYYSTRYGNSGSFCVVSLPVSMRAQPTATGTRGDGGSLTSTTTARDRLQFYVSNDYTTYITQTSVTATAEL